MGTNVTVNTNDVGFFQAPYLIPGTYRIVAELSGFKRHVREGLQLRVGDTLDVELTLDVGGAAEAVTVTADAPLLETSSASLGQVVDARRVAELPTPHGDQQRRSVAHQEHPGVRREDASNPGRGAERVQPPAVPGTEHHADAGGLRHDQRVEPGQLPAAHADDGEALVVTPK